MVCLVRYIYDTECEEACYEPLPGAPTLDKAAREELLWGSLEKKYRRVKQWALRAVESILAGPSRSSISGLVSEAHVTH